MKLLNSGVKQVKNLGNLIHDQSKPTQSATSAISAGFASNRKLTIAKWSYPQQCFVLQH